MSKAGRRVLQLLGVLVALLLLFAALTPVGRYLARAAWEEGKILARRRPIAEVVADPSTPPHVKGKLELVLEVRQFAQDSLELNAGRSFTLYSPLDRDTLVLVLSGAYRDRLSMTRWWFPIVGWVPYKGYFGERRAREAERRLMDDGFDTYLRPASAFSTLGWFNDPLVSPTLRADSLGLADVVIHELLHSTFYAPGQAIFNESFANFVGARGAQEYFRLQGDTTAVARLERRWHDERLLGAFWGRVYDSVDSAYSMHPADSAARVAARDTVFARMREVLIAEIGPRLQATDPGILAHTRFDNAMLLGRRLYLTELDLFDRVWEVEGRSVRSAVKRVIELAKSRPEDPYEAVREWLVGNEEGDGRAL